MLGFQLEHHSSILSSVSWRILRSYKKLSRLYSHSACAPWVKSNPSDSWDFVKLCEWSYKAFVSHLPAAAPATASAITIAPKPSKDLYNAMRVQVLIPSYAGLLQMDFVSSSCSNNIQRLSVEVTFRDPSTMPISFIGPVQKTTQHYFWTCWDTPDGRRRGSLLHELSSAGIWYLDSCSLWLLIACCTLNLSHWRRTLHIYGHKRVISTSQIISIKTITAKSKSSKYLHFDGASLLGPQPLLLDLFWSSENTCSAK